MLLTVHAQPNAKTTEVVEWLTKDTIKIKIAAPPHQGKANDELIKFLAKQLWVSKSEIDFVHGKQGRIKLFKLSLPEQIVRDRLAKN